mmetsp:Transcript_10096/g.20842  ORF Transcript_10096/g.20842 Transcript_10096/m.20842 type:complete len:862 (-) Transcript_10096:44-2629(-)
MTVPDANDDGNSADTSLPESGAQQMSLSSDEVNYLIFRYLQECGFVHSAFSFAHESMLGSTGLRSADKTLPPGALVTFLQKGLQYVGIEEKLRRDGDATEAGKDGKKNSLPDDAGFSILSQTAMSAIARRDPPLELNVPPATAAAAVKARLEAEAKLQKEKAKEAAKSAKAAKSKQASKKKNGSAASDAPMEEEEEEDQQQQPPPNEQQQPSEVLAAIDPSSGQSAALSIADNTASAIAARHALAAQQAMQLQQQQIAAATAAAEANGPAQLSGINAFVAPQQQRSAADILAMQQGAQQLAAVAEASNLADAAALAIQQQRQQQGLVPSANSSASGQPAGAPPAPSAKRLTGGPKRSTKRQKIQNANEEVQRISDTIAGLAAQAGSLQDQIDRNNRGNLTAQMQSAATGNDLEQAVQHQDYRGGSQNALAGQQEFRPIQGEQEFKFTKGHMMAPINGNSKLAMEQNRGMNGDRIENPNAMVNRMESNESLSDLETDTTPDQILKLEMHESEVFMCAWNPIYTDLIATGSGDASARIWQVGGIKAAAGLTTVKLLPHGSDPRDRKNKDVTTLEWSSDGTLLATGSYDGVARVWARNGALIHTLRGHTGPIFSLKWNKQGNFLLSGSYDKTTIVWDVSGSTGFVEQQFTEHQAPALDVDWKDSLTFASCSTDKSVHICRVGVSRPLKVYVGHSDEVNAVKWDPSGRFLASCSDDCTAKIWDVESDRSDPLYDLREHEQEIYTVKWSPTGPGSRNPHMKSLLATASFDGSVRLWDVADGACYRVFNRHQDSVYSVSFSPSGLYLASGSLAGQMYIWDIDKKKHIKSYKGKGDIFEVAWNKEESRVAACFSSNVVAIIDFDRPNS